MKKKMPLFTLGLAFLIMAGLALTTRAAPPRSETLPPRLFQNDLERLDLFDSGPALLKPQQSDEVTNIVPWSKLVFQSAHNGNWDIYLGNSRGFNQTRLTTHSDADIQPRLNRGCTRVVFASNRDNEFNIFAVNPDGSGLMRLTHDLADDVSPAWSPDGTKIAFQSYRDGQPEIYVMNANGSAETRLTWHADYDGMPTWSPDGTKIAFASRRTGGYRIWVMNADGSELTQLSNQPYSGNPTWSPDGSRIAYDSDGDKDGWQELWLMNADGSNQREVYDPGGIWIDAWAQSWSADGRYVAFTRVSFIQYQGNWYWTTGYLFGLDTLNLQSKVRLSSRDTEWFPDWQTTDIWAPTSNVLDLPAQSPATFSVRWPGSDTGEAGIQNYDVQVKHGTADEWMDWQMETTITSASYAGIGGHTYYFRSRARDYAHNLQPWSDPAFTTVEALAPTSAVKPLPPYVRGELTVHWDGGDWGGSGIQAFDVQYRDGASADWSDWYTGTMDTSAAFSGTTGHNYYFRSRATDSAQNVEGWPLGEGDTHTSLYTWTMSGTVRDNAGAPVAGAVITTTPGALGVIPSDDKGSLTAYVGADASAYAVAWAKDGYGSLPPTHFSATQDGYLDVVLPPWNNVVRDWGFENGSLEPHNWLTRGTVAPTIISAFRHTGNYAVMLDHQRSAFTPPLNVSNNPGDSDKPQLAVDANGVVHMVWMDDTPGKLDIYYAWRGNDGVWSSPFNVSHNPGHSYPPQLALDGKGGVHAVWVDDSPKNLEIYYAWRGSNGTAWSGPVNLSNNPSWSEHVQLAAEQDGTVHVVWSDEAPGQNDIYYTWRNSGSAWSSPLNISNNPGFSLCPKVAVDESGTVHVIWKDGNEIYYIRKVTDGNWSAPQKISGDSDVSSFPTLLVDGDEIVHVTWNEHPTDVPHAVIYTQQENDGVWSKPLRISDQSNGYYPPQLAVDENGVVHTTWYSSNQVYYAWRSTDGDWSDPQPISDSDEGVAFAQMALDENGSTHVTWEQFEIDQLEIYYARRGNDGVWSTPKNISQSPGWEEAPQLAVERNGAAHVVWTLDETAPGELYYTGPTLADQADDSAISQVITLPITLSTSTLSFSYLYQHNTFPSNRTWFDVRVDDALTSTTIFSTSSSTDAWTHRGLKSQADNNITSTLIFSVPSGIGAWAHRWFDLSPWAGQAITLTFDVHQTPGNPYAWAYLDEVTLGSSYPDLWVCIEGAATTLPGEQSTYTITYGNQGGAAANSVLLTLTLAPESSLVDASPLPILNTTWEWGAGDLPPKSGPFTIVLTTTVAPTATMFSTLNNTVNIGAISPHRPSIVPTSSQCPCGMSLWDVPMGELETANNTAQSATFVGLPLYLPLVANVK